MSRFLSLLGLSLALMTCGDPAPPSDFVSLSNIPLIPLPYEVGETDGYHLLQDEAPPLTFSEPEVPMDGLTAGWYQLRITPEAITAVADDPEGRLNAERTFRQIVHFAAEQGGAKFLPAGLITDEPRFAYRSYMLDVARTFFDVETIKQVIDRIAAYKINYFHLHLSDDQGWRIEIKSWPKLTEVGSLTQVGEGPGGFYTQEEYRDIVAYAAERGVTIVPEIDLPGHTNAALVAYPELAQPGVPTEPYRGKKVGFSSLNTDLDLTYQFLTDVVGEIADMTPGPYFHLGGDESMVTEDEDYVRFINQTQQIVAQAGKRPIGWNEIAKAELVEGAVAQVWHDPELGARAVAQGNDVIMSPSTRSYLDMKYDSSSRIGYTWAAIIEVDSAYLWDPADFHPEIKEDDILGVEAPLWGETIRNLEDIDYLTFPRLPALAEVAWTAQNRRRWNGFRKRLARHEEWLTEQGIATYRSKVLGDVGK